MTQEQFNERVLNLLEVMINLYASSYEETQVRQRFYQLYHDSNRGKLHLTKK